MLGGLQIGFNSVIDVLGRNLVLGALTVLAGIVIGYLIGKLNKRILRGAGVHESVEGTSFERTAQKFGTSTVSIIASLSTWFVIGVAILLALSIVEIEITELFWIRVTTFVPDLFVGLLILVVGFVLGDKVELVAKEYIRGIKLPQISLLPSILKYSIFYGATLIALGQVGVATNALIVLLAAYVFGFVFIGGLAFQDLLTSGAAGVYLLLTQPYGIGDDVVIDEHEGVVQDLTVFVTWIENEDGEYLIPNRRVLRSGVICRRQD